MSKNEQDIKIIEMTLDNDNRVQFKDVTNLEQANLVDSLDEIAVETEKGKPEMLFNAIFEATSEGYRIAKSRKGPILAVMVQDDFWDILVSDKERLYKREEELFEATKSQGKKPNASLFSEIQKRLSI